MTVSAKIKAYQECICPTPTEYLVGIGRSLGESIEAMEGYYQRRKSGQGRWVKKLREAIDEVSASPEFKDNGSDKPIALTEVPFFDVELVGVPALYYLGSQCFVDNPSFSHLMEEGTCFFGRILSIWQMRVLTSTLPHRLIGK